MLKFAFVVAAVLSVSSISARAEEKMVVDMKKLTCGQLTKLGFQDFAGVTMWLSGYYNSSIRNTVVDLAQFARAASKVKEFCQGNARVTVLSAAERTLGIKMPR
jgi:acid stress chaperone HdeB